MEDNGIRINKFLSEAGVCSRREADRQIDAGNVQIDGVTATMGDRVLTGQVVTYNGQVVSKEEEMILIALNKPAGIVCTAEKREKNNVIDYINYPKRIYPIGRLDKDSEGLLLLTNNGEIVNKMMRSGNMHEKEYLVTVNKTISDSFIRGLAGGVPLVELGVTTRKCHVKKLSSKQFKIILTQGYNRQIRRMCEYFGYRVVKLERVRIMNISLGDLPRGQYRDVTPQEYRGLQQLIADSSNQPVAAREMLPERKRWDNKDNYKTTGRHKGQKETASKKTKQDKNKGNKKIYSVVNRGLQHDRGTKQDGK